MAVLSYHAETEKRCYEWLNSNLLQQQTLLSTHLYTQYFHNDDDITVIMKWEDHENGCCDKSLYNWNVIYFSEVNIGHKNVYTTDQSQQGFDKKENYHLGVLNPASSCCTPWLPGG